ncbi:MAG: alpha/beta hydrolase [Caldilineaceae bacterium]
MKLSHLETGAGQPLIFIHGIGLNAESWRYQLAEFGQQYRAIAVDLPGYGDSDALPNATIAGYTQALRDFVLERRLDRPILVGHSLGGMIVQEYLAAWPGEVAAAVLYGTSPAFGPREGEWQQRFIRARLDPLDAGQTMRDLAPAIVRHMIGSAAQPAGVELAIRCMAQVADDTFRAGVLSLIDFDQRANLGQITIPTLLIVGSKDQNAPPPMVEKTAGKIPDAAYICLAGLGHLAHLEDPALFNQAVHDFLTRVTIQVRES